MTRRAKGRFRETGISIIKAETGEQFVASEADTFHACLACTHCVVLRYLLLVSRFYNRVPLPGDCSVYGSTGTPRK